MRSSLSRWLLARKSLQWFRSPITQASLTLTKAGAFLLLGIFFIIVLASYSDTLRAPSLDIRLGYCGSGPCLASVTPGGLGWYKGARQDMVVLSANGKALSDPSIELDRLGPLGQVDLLTPEGELFKIKVASSPIGESPIKFSVWILASMFTLLGVAVALRRPDLHAARMLCLFTGITGLALAVAPSAGGTGPPWSRIVQFVTIVGVGPSLVLFVHSLRDERPKRRSKILLGAMTTSGLFIIVLYGASLFLNPDLYTVVRPLMLLYLATCVFSAIGLLVFGGIMRRVTSVERQQAQIVMWGIGLSTVPFITLSEIPNAISGNSLLPVHVTILALGIMPAAFAYAVLQHQLLGIRRLVHKGMVYSLTTLLLLILIAIGLALMSEPSQALSARITPIGFAVILVAAVLLFSLLRRVALWLVDNLLYKDVIDYGAAIQVLQKDLPLPSETSNAGRVILQRLASIMKVESAFLFLGQEPVQAQLVAAAGTRATAFMQNLYPQIYPHVQASLAGTGELGLHELRWQSDSVLLVPLTLSKSYMGHLLLGPKEGGEVFVQDEKRLASTIAPFIALAVNESQLSQDLRDLNQRLVKLEESERAKLASDLHDGPLQKVIVLTGVLGANIGNREELARQAVSEIREICTRLRPEILDSLGLVAALEWLINGVAQRSSIQTYLNTRGVGEDDRFPPDVELALFRVTQEAINNISKHSRATWLEVSLARAGEDLELRITDNGVGLPESNSLKKGFGLPGMRERVRQVRGSLEVRSAPGSGTSIIARAPVEIKEVVGEFSQ